MNTLADLTIEEAYVIRMLRAAIQHNGTTILYKDGKPTEHRKEGSGDKITFSIGGKSTELAFVRSMSDPSGQWDLTK